jgi:hypothetical protein
LRGIFPAAAPQVFQWTACRARHSSCIALAHHFMKFTPSLEGSICSQGPTNAHSTNPPFPSNLSFHKLISYLRILELYIVCEASGLFAFGLGLLVQLAFGCGVLTFGPWGRGPFSCYRGWSRIFCTAVP